MIIFVPNAVASIIADEKSCNVPSICRRYGLGDGTEAEAFSGKFRYVLKRVNALTSEQLVELAKAVHRDTPTYGLGETLAKIGQKGERFVTELTRRRIVKTLHSVSLSGQLSEPEFLKKVWPIDTMPAPPNSSEFTMEDFIIRHRINFFDISNTELLELFDIYACSQLQFFSFLEAVTDPLTREIPEQLDLVARLNSALEADRFCLKEIGRISGSPRFRVRAINEGTTPADSEISKALLGFNSTDIHERWQEALERRARDPRAAITLARTLVEDTCKWIFHEADEEFEDEDELPVLYRRLAKCLKLAPDDHTEKVFKQILGSCQSIVESLGSVRNRLGDAHSQGPKRARPQARHAELAVNLAGAMATFLIATWEARRAAPP